MSEKVLVRLGSQYEETIHWLVFSSVDHSVKASGVLPHAGELKALANWCATRPLMVLVPGCDFIFRQASFPGRLSPSALQALPFLLEESIATEPGSLHVSVLAKQQSTLSLCAVDKQQMHNWLGWLNESDLIAAEMFPDVLALPMATAPDWHAMQLGEQWLFRFNQTGGAVVDSVLLPDWLSGHSQLPVIHSLTTLPDAPVGEWRAELHDFPLALLAGHLPEKRYSLLNGLFAAPKKPTWLSGRWLQPALLMLGWLLLVGIGQGIEIYQHSRTLQQLQDQMRIVYRQTFPREKRIINPYVQFKQHVGDVTDPVEAEGFLSVLGAFSEGFRAQSACQVKSVRFEQNALRLTVRLTGRSFAELQALKDAIPTIYPTELNNMMEQHGTVEGTLIVRGKV